MLALYELPGGYALFKIIENGDPKLLSHYAFENTEKAVEAVQSLMNSELHSTLKKFLKKSVVKQQLDENLAVQDAKLGGLIKKELGIPCIHSEKVDEILRGIREQVTELIEGLSEKSFHQMSLGLAHSLSRHILKFSPEKIDVMIIQAINLLDDLDKELNTYAMRLKEWYGWHFPELTKLVTENVLYARLVLFMGLRENAPKIELSEILDEEVVPLVKEAAIHSMGVGLTENDLANIRKLAEEVVATSEYRSQLYDYLINRMNAIAPNLSAMLGEIVGSRLISNAGSLMNLSKLPASTMQILGSEKALFRALKEKGNTPKYGLIYHASLVTHASSAHKGKIARLTACKASLASRVDALAENNGDTAGPSIGVEGRIYVETRLRNLEAGLVYKSKGERPTTQKPYSRFAEQAKRPDYQPPTPFVMKTESEDKSNKEEEKCEEKPKKKAKLQITEDTEEEPKPKKKKAKAEKETN